MKVKYSPQINYEDIVEYEFNGDIITATLDGVSEIFDFTDMPNDSMTSSIEIDLRVQVIESAKRDTDGVLWVNLFKAITEEEFGTVQEWEEV